MTETKKIVGIFSRDNKVCYRWLIHLLRSRFFHPAVRDVRAVTITNNNQSDVLSELSGCTFGILYHTGTRGRINVVSVSDSLYNHTLDQMCAVLGRENVVVLLDDLEESSQASRTEILKTQYDILNKACELILISTSEKKSCDLYGSNPRWSECPTSPQLQEEYLSMRNKRSQIRDIISPNLRGDFTDDDDSQITTLSDSHGGKGDTEDENSQITTNSSGNHGGRVSGEGTIEEVPLVNNTPSASDTGHPRQTQKISNDPEGPPAPKRRKIPNLSDKSVFIIIGAAGGILLIAFIVIVATL